MHSSMPHSIEPNLHNYYWVCDVMSATCILYTLYLGTVMLCIPRGIIKISGLHSITPDAECVLIVL